MKDLTKSPNVQSKQKVQLVEGGFAAEEAMDIISALIEEKINFHKLQSLCINERDLNPDTQYEQNRINELLNEMRIAKDYLSKAKENGQMVAINGVLEICIITNQV